jgi:hypothetical protein
MVAFVGFCAETEGKATSIADSVNVRIKAIVVILVLLITFFIFLSPL